MAEPNTGDLDGGQYNPTPLPYPALPSYQQFINQTNGLLSVQIQDSLHNLLTMAPNLHAENLLLAGENVVWLRRLTTGEQCPNWINEEDQDAISKCPICYNTGFVGGFDIPIQLKMSFTPNMSDITVEQVGLTISQRPTAWTIATTPNIESRDMIVTYQNERYIVHAAEVSDKQGRKMNQTLTLARVDKTDVLYYVPVPGVNGEAFTDFAATIAITPVLGTAGTVGQSFPATILIRNRFFYSANDGLSPLNVSIEDEYISQDILEE
jgi:hypothetical protein